MLLLVQPCDEEEEEEEEEAAAAGVNVGQGLGEVSPTEEEGGVRVLCSLLPAGPEDETELLDTSDPLDSTASPEELEEEENSGDSGSGGGDGNGGGGGARENGGNSRTCIYEGCQETGSGGAQGAKQRKPWMCKKHRNKVYKDKYKRKKSDQATAGSARGADCTENAVSSVAKQRTTSVGDRPARPTLLEQVLNQKRLSLLRSPEVVQFLKTQQQLLSQQAFEQRRPFPEASV